MPKLTAHEDALVAKGVEYILATPKALATLGCSYLSGHLWAYIILTYYRDKRKGKDFLDKLWGKVALGFIWFALISLPVYYLMHGTLVLEYDKLLDSVVTALVLGLAVQAAVFIGLTLWKR